MISKTIVFGVIIIAVSYYYDPITWTRFVRRLNSVNSSSAWEIRIANAWDKQILQPRHKKSRIAVGINVNADLIVSATDLFGKLQVTASGKREDHSILKSMTDLEETFAYYFLKGAAGERFFANKEIFSNIIATADRLKEKNYFVGGNAALVALNIASSFPDIQILLIGPTGPKVQRMLLPNIEVPPSSKRKVDEIHLIMEYAKGELWGENVTPVATRFITSHDISNSEMDSLSGFSDNVKGFNPDVVVFSGLHLLEGKTPEFQSQRISLLLDQLMKFPEKLPVHLELASMADRNLVSLLYNKVIGEIHSLGLNEQELSLVAEVMGGTPEGLEAINGHPDIPSVADVLLATLRAKRKTKLTRIHFHCLTYHIIATRKGHWSNSKSAVAAGTKTAGVQACQDDRIVPSKVELRVPKLPIAISNSPIHGDLRQFSPYDPVVTWEISGVEFHFSPVLVCKKPVKTVGLGDAISGTGLVYSDFIS